MKITTQVTADVDLAAWRTEFEFEGTDSEVVADIERYMQRMAEIQLASLAVLADPVHPRLANKRRGGQTRVEFLVDGRCPGTRYTAVSFDDSPVVTREQFKTLLANEDPDGEFYRLDYDSDGNARLHQLEYPGDDSAWVLPVNVDGNYDLGYLDWTFLHPAEQDVRANWPLNPQTGSHAEENSPR